MRIFYILSFILLIATSSMSQTRIEQSNPESKIVKFFPNPAITQITFSLDRGFDKDCSLQVFNFIGKKVYELQGIGSRNIVDLSDFYRGLYIFQLRDKTGKIIDSGKFQVAR